MASPALFIHGSARVDFAATKAPLLFLTGTHDHLTPVAMVRRNARKYTAGQGGVDYREFDGRSHYICGEPGWEEVADAALEWVRPGQTQTPRPSAGASLIAQARWCSINDARAL
jgi:pimeloyl-ACP methyl ester carboxylesterase